jgi:nucleotide-binding universal stress UspA family protein
MYNNLLLVADNLNHALPAARMVGETARRMGSADLCIAVAYAPVADCLGSPYTEQATARRQAKAEALAQRLLREVGSIPGKVQTELLAGTMAEVTRTIAQTHGSDLIVMGSEEPGPLRRLWARRHDREVVDLALCPVLIVG